MRAEMGNAPLTVAPEAPPIMPKANASTGKRTLGHRDNFETKQIPVSTHSI